jgi:glycosyltransferase involved in cell wall biosynthesis
MKVTVVVRTYKRPHFLKEALASIQLQTHKDWEVLIFDDAGSLENFEIYTKFKSYNPDKRIMYITSKQEYELFQNSWLLAPDLANGEVMVRLDDDDLLVNDSLEFISETYEKNPELEFSYGSAYNFNDDGLITLHTTINPFEAPKTKANWTGYTIANNHPWTHPWSWTTDFFKEPENYSSLIHCAKANIFCIIHTYVMRTESVKRVKDKIEMTSKYIDDLEFLGSLDYLGLGHNALKKPLCYIREHGSGRITDPGKVVDGINIWQENYRIRDKVDYLRKSGFLSKIIPLESDKNHNEGGVTDTARDTFKAYQNRIKELITG